MRRVLGITAGLATHALFVYTVYRLYGFLAGAGPESAAAGLWLNAGLSLAFGASHSLFLHPHVRELPGRHIAPAFYGLVYCVVTCSTLLALMAFWQHSPVIWWELTGISRSVVNAAWFGSWGVLLYSLWLSGMGYQTGFTPWWNWVCGRPIAPRPFAPRGLYLWIRHPVYLSFLGLVWLSPVMSADRLILIATWTPYVFIGSYLKDERMAYYLGEQYRQYQARVPGFPGLWFGPLGLRVLEPDSQVATAALSVSPVSGRECTAAVASIPVAADSKESSLCSSSR